MARPIAETPILKGKDVVQFEKNLKYAEIERVPDKELARILENFRKMKSLEKQA
jgi:aryl-alcohol dehydrogenase-like predicted oxidoreductase